MSMSGIWYASVFAACHLPSLLQKMLSKNQKPKLGNSLWYDELPSNKSPRAMKTSSFCRFVHFNFLNDSQKTQIRFWNKLAFCVSLIFQIQHQSVWINRSFYEKLKRDDASFVHMIKLLFLAFVLIRNKQIVNFELHEANFVGKSATKALMR